jgi:pimeloyl-ACP methyl ester carboxylesterase
MVITARWVVGTWLALGLLLAPTSSRPTRAAEKFQPASCPFTTPPELVTTHPIRCGFLTVPESRSGDTSNRTLRLAVAIVSAAKPGGREPIVYLAGGPGASATGDLPLLFRDGSPILPLLEDNDWIFVDQRGTGHSKPRLSCPEAPILGPVPDDSDQVTPAWACGGRLTDEGINLAAFNTRENAADVADLVAALGYARANLYGVSYGSRLALRVARDFPRIVRTLVLDGVFPPQANGQASVPGTYSRALTMVFDACASDAVCNRGYPDLGGTYARLMDRLHSAPPQVSYVDAHTEATKRIPLNGPTFTSLLFLMLYQKEGVQLVPAMISMTEAGNLAAAEALLPVLSDYSALVGEGMFFAVECTDEGQRPPTPTLELEPLPWSTEDLPYGRDLATICGDFPAARQTPAESAPVVSDVPTLLLSGAFDPTTPPEYAHLAAASLDHSVEVEFTDQGHVALFSGACATGIVRTFLSQPEQPPATECAAHGAVQFVLP